MTDLPEWLQKGLTNPKCETIGPRIRLRGHSPNQAVSMEDFLDVLEGIDPPGYVLSKACIKAEHARGRRLCWEVVWLLETEANRRYQDKQAARMSRYEVQG